MTPPANRYGGRHAIALAGAACVGGLVFYAILQLAYARGFDVVIAAGEDSRVWLLLIGCALVFASGTYALVWKLLTDRAARREARDRLPVAVIRDADRR
jgi:hypothetical protein